MLPRFRQQTLPKMTAARILEGRTFKVQLLLDEARQAAAASGYPICEPAALHNLVILRLAILSASIAPGRSFDKSSYDMLNKADREALSCAPSDAFAWLTLFWLDVVKNGFSPNNANYLRLSYALGPHESWISLWRNRLSFSLFERLPPDLADDAIDEFINLVDTRRLYGETARTFAVAPVGAQTRIVEHLQTANPISRRAFATALYERGINVLIPGEIPPEARPWR